MLVTSAWSEASSSEAGGFVRLPNCVPAKTPMMRSAALQAKAPKGERSHSMKFQDGFATDGCCCCPAFAAARTDAAVSAAVVEYACSMASKRWRDSTLG